eukprot:351729-Chlamydomonas_euryale.AAC.5
MMMTTTLTTTLATTPPSTCHKIARKRRCALAGHTSHSLVTHLTHWSHIDITLTGNTSRTHRHRAHPPSGTP